MRERNEESKKDGKPRRGRWSRAETARLRVLYGLRDDASIARELNRPLLSVRKMAEKIFPLEEREGPWLPEEVERLKTYLGASKSSVIARILGRSQAEVEHQISLLASIQGDAPWTRDEIARFKRIFGTRTNSDLAAVFGRPVEAIHALALEHALAKDKTFRRKLEGDSSTRMPRWRPQEVELLCELYPHEPNRSIAKRLNRTVKSVVSKAHNLDLKKSSERLQSMGRENVSLRYTEDPARLAPDPSQTSTPASTSEGGEPIVELPVTPRPASPAREPQEAAPAAESEMDIPRPHQGNPAVARQSSGGQSLGSQPVGGQQRVSQEARHQTDSVSEPHPLDRPGNNSSDSDPG